MPKSKRSIKRRKKVKRKLNKQKESIYNDDESKYKEGFDENQRSVIFDGNGNIIKHF